MANTQYLRKIIKNSNFTIENVAKSIGLSRQGFSKKLDNQSEFKASEIKKITELLRLSRKEKDYIFFGDFVDVTSTKK